jgi:lipid-binding SYLF domain-containing protein
MSITRFAATFTSVLAIGAGVGLAMGLSGCHTAPTTDTDRQSLMTQSSDTLAMFRRQDPGIGTHIDQAYGYAVFPSVGKGGLGVGGAYGHGIVYEQGRPIGYTDLRQATVGAQIGGQSFRELVLFQDKVALDAFRKGEWAMAAQASAVAAASGASAKAKYNNGVMVFVTGEEGLMAEASVGGQKFTYQPM